MSGGVAIPEVRSSEVARRVAVTAGGIALFLAGERIPLPFVDEETFRLFGGHGPPSRLAPLSLAITPFVAGYLLVELVAVTVPALRSLRHGSARERLPLTRAAWAIALALAAWQGWAAAIELQSVPDLRGDGMLAPGLRPALGFAAALVLGTLATGCIAMLVSRHGVGNGFAVLLAVGAVERLWLDGTTMLLQPPGSWSDASLLAGLALVVVVPLVAARIRRGGPGAGPRVPLPACGLVPLSGTNAVLDFPAKLAVWFAPAAPLAAALEPDTWLDAFVAVALAASLAILFAHLFCPPGAVVSAFRRSAPDGLDDEQTAAVRGAARLANRRSVALVVGLALVPVAAALLATPVDIGTDAIFDLAVVIAVALDLEDEVRARFVAGALVAARPLHPVYAVAPALQALSAAGIAGHARTRRFRTLFHFFAPYAPVEVLVPRERLAEAEAICARIVSDPAAGEHG